MLKTRVKLRDEFCVETRADPCALVIFGVTGDLARRKLIPALAALHRRNLLPDRFFILGAARAGLSDEAFRQRFSGPGSSPGFLRRLHYARVDLEDQESMRRLGRELRKLVETHGTGPNRLIYLALPPRLYPAICRNLEGAGLAERGNPAVRIIVEKPFGSDLKSAEALDRQLREHFTEEQIYRIDHYLGKETVQNILMLRFANAIFEPLWNRGYIEHVQITAAESIGVEERGEYYDRTGALRDMGQNHLLQLLTLVAIEPPTSFEADRIRDEKAKLLRSIRPFPRDPEGWIVRGQYRGYREEGGVARDSRTETFVAMKLLVDNWRWQGVPFYLRTGKRLAKKRTEIVITFKPVPHSMFAPLPREALSPNQLVLNVQPEEGIELSIEGKRPGPKLCMSTLTLDFDYREVFGVDPPGAYERLLLDAMQGDATLFVRRDILMDSWRLLTPVLEAWEQGGRPAVYEPGTWGPREADELLERDGRAWRNP